MNLRCSVWAVVAVGALASGCAAAVEAELPLDETDGELLLPLCIGTPTYYVDDSAASGGSGTSAAPFRTIFAALTASKQLNHCSVTVVVSPGYYYGSWGRLTIDRQTTIRGTDRGGVHIRAGFINTSGRPLRIETATIEYATRAAVRAVHSRTELASVTIRATYYAGVDQTGGSLDVRDVSVYDLRGESRTASAPALHVKAGATAVIRNVYAARNPQGLVAVGAGTHVDVDRLYVYYTDRAVAVDCARREGHAAVAVSGEAVMTGRRVYVYMTQGAAFDVYDAGLLALDTAGAWEVRTECPLEIGAVALLARHGGIAALSNFTLSSGGFGVLATGEHTEVDLWDGQISAMLDAAICAPSLEPNRFRDLELFSNRADYCAALPPGTSLPPPTPIDV